MLLLALVAACSCRPLAASEVVARVRDAYRTESIVATVRMTIISSSGDERTREFEVKSRHTATWSRTRADVLYPSDIAGFAVLLVDRVGSAHDEWTVKIPAIKRTMPL